MCESLKVIRFRTSNKRRAPFAPHTQRDDFISLRQILPFLYNMRVTDSFQSRCFKQGDKVGTLLGGNSATTLCALVTTLHIADGD